MSETASDHTMENAAQANNGLGLVDKLYLLRNHKKLSSKYFQTTSELGKMVLEARKSMNMTQQTFADLAGVGRRFVSELEAGKPTLEFGRVLKVCHAAGIDLLAVKR